MTSMKVVLRFALMAPLLLGLGGCLGLNFLGFGGGSSNSIPPAERQLPASTQALLAIKGMKQESPVFIRIFKEESELEVWKLKDGRFQHFRTYSICAWSGGLGPKVQQGDRQAPEGFYTVSRGQLNPHSLYHLAFNIGFPNAYDRSNGHNGSALMVHGNCKSAGCYAMTDAYIEEIYILAREAFSAGQTRFHVHAYPFRMTADNMQRHRDSPWYPFWHRMKEGYDAFEATGKPPVVKVCSKQYLVNVSFPSGDPAPDAPCPAHTRVDLAATHNIDGVPPTLLASLNKPAGQAQPAPASVPSAPPVIAASYQSAPQSAPAPAANTSASPVITRQAQKPETAIASMQPAPPPAAAPAYPASNAPARFQVGSAAFASQPPGKQAAAAPAPPSANTPRELDPDSLQKPNRSGKGGKWTTDAVSIGSPSATPQ